MIRSLGLIFLASAVSAEPAFRDMSQGLPLHEYTGDWEHFVGGGVAVFDCNGDALPDLFAAGGTSVPLLAVNRGSFQFEPVPLPELAETVGAYPLDIDSDGHLDLFVLQLGGNHVLQGGPDCSFTDVTDEWAIPSQDKWSTAFTAWWDGDGFPTLAIGNYVDRSNPDGPFFACDDNMLLTPSAGPGQDPAYSATPLTPGFCPLSMLAARDARGQMTLRLSNDKQYYVRGGYEQMWDIAQARFLTEEDGWAKVSLWGMGIASRDLNADGRDEVMLTSMGDQLLQIANPDGTYSAASYGLGTTAHIPHNGTDGRPSTGWHAQFGDIDNDARPDLFIAKGNVDQMPSNAIHDPNNLLMQAPDGSFAEKADVAGVATTERSRGAALADFDLDGRLDLVVVNRRARMELYRNETPDAGHWISIALTQPGGNRHAVGAEVTVVAGGVTQIQQVTIGGGHAGGQALPLHFGLGAATAADITVRWPDPGLAAVTLTAPADHAVIVTRD